jgi:hypothetical protein
MQMPHATQPLQGNMKMLLGNRIRRPLLRVKQLLLKIEGWLLRPLLVIRKHECVAMVVSVQGNDAWSNEPTAHFYIQCNRCGHVFGDTDDPEEALMVAEALNRWNYDVCG